MMPDASGKDTKYTRYQGAIVRDGHLLLLQQTDHASGSSYWLLPGGRREPGETDRQCVEREMLEEVGLRVRVDALILDEPIESENIDRRKTYRCSVVGGDPRPGHEPEEAYTGRYSFTGLRWVDLARPHAWAEEIVADQGPLLGRIREALETNVRDAPGP